MLAVTQEPYSYVGGDPMNAVDPSGMLSYKCRGASNPESRQFFGDQPLPGGCRGVYALVAADGLINRGTAVFSEHTTLEVLGQYTGLIARLLWRDIYSSDTRAGRFNRIIPLCNQYSQGALGLVHAEWRAIDSWSFNEGNGPSVNMFASAYGAFGKRTHAYGTLASKEGTLAYWNLRLYDTFFGSLGLIVTGTLYLFKKGMCAGIGGITSLVGFIASEACTSAW
jgi:hypothetical protein